MIGNMFATIDKKSMLIMIAVAIVITVVGYLVYKKMYGSSDTMATEMFDEPNKKVLIFFRATWCGHCTRFKPVWDDFCTAKAENSGLSQIDVLEVDVDKEESKPMLQKHNVRGFPHVVLTADGSSDVVYSGNRTKEDLLSFLEKNA